MIKIIFIAIISITACVSQPVNRPPVSSHSMEETQFELNVSVESDGNAESLPLMVTLVNKGDKTWIVNNRMSVGYKEDMNREIYLEIIDAITEEQVGGKTKLYERNPVSHEDFTPLSQGDETSVTFNLFDWWQVPQGSYQVKVFYHGTSNEYVQYPEGMLNKTISSEWIAIELP